MTDTPKIPNTPELLPCPFCGDKGRPIFHEGRGAKCHRCKAWGPDPMVPFADWNTRTPPQAPDGQAQLKAGVAQPLLRLLEKLQSATSNYLEPTTYIRQRPGGTCKYDSEVEMPAHNHADSQIALINKQRDNAFISDIIYMLDGPEQRAAESRIRAALSETSEPTDPTGTTDYAAGYRACQVDAEAGLLARQNDHLKAWRSNILEHYHKVCADVCKRCADAVHALTPPNAPPEPQLSVWFGEMPESNGRKNWSAILENSGQDMHLDSFCFARSEYPDRVKYEADRMRWIIGERSDRPNILAYDEDAHSGYVPPEPNAAEAAKVLLDDDVTISKMAEAMHNGPLAADDHWFSASTPSGAWCVDMVRAGLRAALTQEAKSDD